MKAGEHDRLPEGDNAGAERWLEFGYLLPYCSFNLRFGDCSLWSDGLQAVRVWIPTESVRRYCSWQRGRSPVEQIRKARRQQRSRQRHRFRMAVRRDKSKTKLVNKVNLPSTMVQAKCYACSLL